MMIRKIAMVTLLVAIVAAPAQAAFVTVSSFDDILFWTGSGSNRAALVLDFGDPDYGDTSSPRAIAWGYRWDAAETRTMADMLFSLAGNIEGGPSTVSGSDPRLSLVVDSTDLETFGYGLETIHYDQVGLPGEWSQQSRTITRDEYWTFYAAQFNAATASGAWQTTFAANNFGISGMQLMDGGWYGVVSTGWAPSYEFAQPVAAVPEPSAIVLVACGAAAGLVIRRRRHRAA